MSLVERVQEILPGAAPLFQGHTNTASAVVEWGEHTIVVDEECDVYRIGIYTNAGWVKGEEPLEFAEIGTNIDAVVALLDDLTDIEADDWLSEADVLVQVAEIDTEAGE
jgi:hypothetical protein